MKEVLHDAEVALRALRAEADVDAVPAPPDAATTKPGERIRLGRHVLMCGDSAKAEDVDRLLAGALVHMVNMDPPYGVRVEPRSNNAIAAGPTPTPPPASAVMNIVAAAITWNTPFLTGLAGQELTVNVDNQDDAVLHNFAVYDGPDSEAELIAATELENGPVEQTLTFGPLEPGEYYYNCEVHPAQMEGILTVVEEGAAPADGAAPDETPAPGETPAP